MKLYQPSFDRHANLSKQYPELGKLYSQSMGFWFGSSPYKTVKNVSGRVRRLLTKVFKNFIETKEENIVVLILYSIPGRDLGYFSKGGEKSYKKYLEFITEVSKGIGDSNPIVIFEPDALPQSYQMKYDDKIKRVDLCKKSLEILKNNKNASIYLDIGHPYWLDSEEAVEILSEFDKSLFKGFSLNVSNFVSTKQCIIYGDEISKQTSKSYIIDTSRNGMGYTGDWCNPEVCAIGELPTFKTESENCDAYLWVKPLGESDGKQKGSPKAGRFYLNHVLKVIENSKKIGTFNF